MTNRHYNSLEALDEMQTEDYRESKSYREKPLVLSRVTNYALKLQEELADRDPCGAFGVRAGQFELQRLLKMLPSTYYSPELLYEDLKRAAASGCLSERQARAGLGYARYLLNIRK